jgi:hypothetical protein
MVIRFDRVAIDINTKPLPFRKHVSWVPVAHACNPSYLGGRDQEDPGSKPVQANNLRDPISKKPITKKG